MTTKDYPEYRIVMAGEPYVTAYGIPYLFNVWQGKCIDCQTEFTQRRPARTKEIKKRATRRCSACIARRKGTKP